MYWHGITQEIKVTQLNVFIVWCLNVYRKSMAVTYILTVTSKHFSNTGNFSTGSMLPVYKNVTCLHKIEFEYLSRL